MKKLAVIGSGSWGTALSLVLAPRFDAISLWAHDPRQAQAIEARRENAKYLAGFVLPQTVHATNCLREAVTAADAILLAVPSQHLRRVVREMATGTGPQTMLISATKGLEAGSLFRMSEVIREELKSRFEPQIAVLSGPTFAHEVALGEPTAVVISAADLDVACKVQEAFSGPTFRLYTNTDPTGVEIAGALKNVIAIGAGICEGLGLGGNPVAALVTRGLAEITRLAVAMKGEARTLSGLAGLGDLVLTCTGDLSRNRRVGIELAHGRKLPDILASTSTVAEGVQTTYAAVELAARYGLELPITQQMYEVLKLSKEPKDAIRFLMERTLKSE